MSERLRFAEMPTVTPGQIQVSDVPMTNPTASAIFRYSETTGRWYKLTTAYWFSVSAHG